MIKKIKRTIQNDMHKICKEKAAHRQLFSGYANRIKHINIRV